MAHLTRLTDRPVAAHEPDGNADAVTGPFPRRNLLAAGAHRRAGWNGEKSSGNGVVICQSMFPTDILIRRPVAVVSGYSADPANAPEWYRNIESATWQTAPPVQAGSRNRLRRPVPRPPAGVHLRGHRASTGPRLVMRTEQGPFPMETTYTWAAAGNDATTMTLRNRGERRLRLDRRAAPGQCREARDSVRSAAAEVAAERDERFAPRPPDVPWRSGRVSAAAGSLSLL